MIGTFMDSRAMRASLHLLGSSINGTNNTLDSNIVERPLIASTNSSHLSVTDSLFHGTTLMSVSTIEFDSSVAFLHCGLVGTAGAVANGRHGAIDFFSMNSISRHRYNDMLIVLAASRVSVSAFSFSNS
jgi:hypothetical protein